MARYAFVRDGSIVSVHEHLPDNWENVSNFFALKDDEAALKSYGWYVIQQQEQNIDRSNYMVGPTQFKITDNGVEEYQEVHPLTQPQPTPIELQWPVMQEQLWVSVRQTRDQKMREFEWRYNRYYREQRLGIQTTDKIEDLDAYMQRLADVTKLFIEPNAVVWPEWSN